MKRAKIINTFKTVVERLVHKNYHILEKEDFCQEGLFEPLWNNIEEFGGNLSMPPDKEFENLEIIELKEGGYYVEFYLWKDEKISELTIRVFIKEINSQYQFSIQDILVM